MISTVEEEALVLWGRVEETRLRSQLGCDGGEGGPNSRCRCSYSFHSGRMDFGGRRSDLRSCLAVN